ATYEATKGFFADILKLLHPFMPFLTEELWHDELFGDRTEMDCCIVAPYPVPAAINSTLLKDVEVVQQVISEVRNIRNSKQISPKEQLPLAVKVNSAIEYSAYIPVISKLANISEVTFVTDKPGGASAFLAGTDEFFVSLAESIDAEAEKERLTKEIDYLNGFLKAVNAKLSNERFVQNAKPEIVDNERKKKADAEAKISILEESLKAL
ncbi:MAG TPA: class I tRNA ligase family protein, partial [Sphingobacteriaceae bacterium]